MKRYEKRITGEWKSIELANYKDMQAILTFINNTPTPQFFFFRYKL